MKKEWRNWGDNPIIVFLGLIVAVISLVVFVTGKPDLPSILNNRFDTIDTVSPGGKVSATVLPEASDTPKPFEFPTNASTAVLSSMPEIYDDFNEIIEDGGINYSLWAVDNDYGESCLFSQDHGYLEITHLPSVAMTGCFLRKSYRNLSGNELNMLEMKAKVINNYRGDCCNSISLVLSSEGFSSEGGFIECGLHPGPGNNVSVFKIVHHAGDVEEFRSTRVTTFDDWHTLRLEVDQRSFEISCYLDSALVGAYIPNGEAKLRKASFSQYLQAGWASNSTVTFQIDDVTIHP